MQECDQDHTVGAWAGALLGAVHAKGDMASSVVGWDEGSWGLGEDWLSQSLSSTP